VLLDINQELLYEIVSLMNSKAEVKKAQQAEADGGGNGDVHPVDYAEEEKLLSIDYNSCMRRLHSNLAYMALLVDRKGQLPPSPNLTPPPLNLNLKLRVPPSPQDESAEKPPDPNSDRADRDRMLKETYRKLQGLYPGIDPRTTNQNPGQRPGQQQPGQNPMRVTNGQGLAGDQGSNHSSPAPTPGGGGGGQVQKTPQMANTPAPPQGQM